MVTVLIISIIFQLIAVWFSFRLIYITQRYTAWILIAFAILLMAVRRSITLVSILTKEEIFPGASTAEFVALAISILISVGLILIEPLFKKMKKNEIKLEENNQSFILKNIEVSRLNQKLKEQNEELKVKNTNIQIINRELNKAKEKAEESDRLKSAFLANMSHEIRTPMNGIIGFSGMLNESGISEEKRMFYIDIITQSSHQLLSIVNDLLDISKIETGQMELNEDKIFLNALMDDLYSFFKPKADESKISLTHYKGLADEHSTIYSDGVKIRQILSNLVSNALKFTQKGQITFGYNPKDNELEFFVEDSGIGIDLEMHEKIFERFRQADDATTRRYGGAGLGLSICKGYAELLGGKIWLDSLPDNGSTFYFTTNYQPVDTSVKAFESEQIKYDNPDLKGFTILIAEDEEFNFLFVKEVLENHHMQVIHAKDGKEAWDKCIQYPEINLVLMDIKMPNMNGFEATRLIKERNPNLPIIAQTAYAMADDKEKILNAGCDDYISKPLKKEQLLKLLKKYLLKDNQMV